jgi:hypothetical protein
MTPAQLLALKGEILGDPLGLGYAAHLPDSPGLVVDLLNAPTQSMIKAIKSTTAQAWAATGPYSNIVDASEDKANPCRASCLMLRDTFASAVDIHMEMADVQQMFAAWVAVGICTQVQADALYARAVQPASRAEVLGFPNIDIRDLVAAGVI